MKKFLITAALSLISLIGFSQISYSIIYVDGAKHDSISYPDSNYVVNGLTASTSYDIQIQSVDVDGNVSPLSTLESFSTRADAGCPTIDVTGAVTNVTCNGDSDGAIDITVTGGQAPLTYLWTGGSTNEDLTGVAGGNYSVLVTDDNGCTGANNWNIIEPDALVASNIVHANVSCNGDNDGSATASAIGGTGGYTYSWGSATQSNLTAGIYEVIVTDGNSCTDTTDVVITEPALLAFIAEEGSNILCFGDETGTLSATVTGGTSPFNWVFDDGVEFLGVTQTSISRLDLPAGAYGLTVTDDNGCFITTSITITQNSQIQTATTVTNVSEVGQTDGSIAVTVTGGITPYSYLWAPDSETTATISNKGVGTYGVTITDGEGCIEERTYVIKNPASESGIVINLTDKDVVIDL